MSKSTEPTHDETAAAYFKSGWDAALREVATRIEFDRLDEFLEEQRRGRVSR